jgi:RNase P/RNase MRP subunit POP5
MVRALRRRYIALVASALAPQVLDARCLAALRTALGPEALEAVRARLFHLRPGAAVVRVDHRTQARAVAALDGLALPGGGAVRTVTTSGTLRQAKRALGVRESARRRPRGRRAPRASRGPRSAPRRGVRRPGNP